MRKIFWILFIGLVVLRVIFVNLIQQKYPNGTILKITDRVRSEPIQYDYSQRISIQGFKFYLPKYPEIYYGDEIVVKGLVEGRELRESELLEIKESKNIVYKLKQKFVVFFQKSLPQPHSSLTAGMVLGSKSAIPNDFWQSLKVSGTAHVVVASGMNVSLVAGFFINFLIIFVKRPKAVIFTLIVIWFYALITGFDAPIVRAAIMGSIAFTAQGMGKIYQAFRGLLISGMAMLIYQPQWLNDLGFILSFTATASLILFEHRIHKYLKRVPTLFQEGLSTSLAAQIGVAPILFITFGQFNLLSPIINAAVLWTVAPITIIGMVAVIVSLVSQTLGWMVLLVSYPLTSWFIWVVQTAG